MTLQKITYWIGKLLIVITFLYFGIEGVIEPSTYVNYIPDWISNFINPEIVVVTHGVIETILALFILFSLGGTIPLIVLIVLFVGILFVVSGATLIRDIGILGGLFLLLHGYIKNKDSLS